METIERQKTNFGDIRKGFERQTRELTTQRDRAIEIAREALRDVRVMHNAFGESQKKALHPQDAHPRIAISKANLAANNKADEALTELDAMKEGE